MARIAVTVDGARHEDEVEPRTLLVHWLRDSLGLVGTPVGCDTSQLRRLHGARSTAAAPKSCSLLAVQADGTDITTIEGLANGEWHPVQTAFKECHALQCGYCTPGMVLASVDLLSENPDPTEAEIREGLKGNLCRCTGYHNIVKAVGVAAEMMKEGLDSDRHRGAHHGHRQPDPPQGGRAAAHRADPVDRQHRAAGHAAHGVRAQPDGARAHHEHRRWRRPRRCRTSSTCSPPPTSARPTPRCRASGRSPTTSSCPTSTCSRSPRSATSATASLSSWPPTRPRPRTRSKVSTSSTRRSPQSSTWRPRSPRALLSCTPSAGTNKCYTATLPCGDYAAAKATSDVVVTRRFVNQRLIPTPMEPRSVACVAHGRERGVHALVLDPGAARAAGAARAVHRHPGEPAAGHRSRRRRRFRLQAADLPRGDPGARAGEPARPPGQVDRDAQREHGRHPPRPRPDPGHRDRGRRATARSRASRSTLLANMGAYLQIITPGTPLLGMFMYNGIYKMDAYRLHLHRRLHHQDPHRRLPGRGPTGGDVRHRADRRRARRRARHGPAGAAPQELDQARGVPVHARSPASPTTRQLRGGHSARPGAVRLRRAARGAGRRAGSPATRCSSASASRPSPRCAGSRRRGRWAR